MFTGLLGLQVNILITVVFNEIKLFLTQLAFIQDEGQWMNCVDDLMQGWFKPKSNIWIAVMWFLMPEF